MSSVKERLYQKAKQALDLYKEKRPDDTESIAVLESLVVDLEDFLIEEAE